MPDVVLQPRDCTHPDFPLRKHCRALRGRPYAEWTKKFSKTRISFGACTNDPTGAIAWELFKREWDAWERGENPRAGKRQLATRRIVNNWTTAFLISGPLERAGVALVDVATGQLKCKACGETWRVRFSDPAAIPRRRLICPNRCSCQPIEGVRAATKAIGDPDCMPAVFYARVNEARAAGWQAMPLNVDREAEAEGEAAEKFAKKFAVRRQGRRKRVTANRVDLAKIPEC